MKDYIGVKVVTAEPMSRGEYNEYRGWKIRNIIRREKVKNGY